MIKKYAAALCCFAALAICHNVNAQDKKNRQKAYFRKTLPADANGHIPCVTDEYENYLKKNHPTLQSREEFEINMAAKIEASKNNFQLKNTNTVITLPVVVHVIHNGDAIGTDENITDDQVISQIQVLNEDFRKMLDTPGYNDHPDGADMEIEFCLAQRDPGGSPTTGIEHINLGRASWDNFEDIDLVLKAETQWDPERYLNIWVCKMGGEMSGIDGYAFYPELSGLEGLEGAEGYAEIDGVILSYLCMGSEDLYPEGDYIYGRDKGRSATHEVGHFFGLIHIWGNEDSCDATDFCDDTPPVVGLHFSCSEADTCTEDAKNDMIENHMDYTLDQCKNIFTNDQKTRVWTVLENSPRRMSLATSNSCVYPEDVEFDGSLNIDNIEMACSGPFSIELTLTNIGSATMTEATISYTIDNGAAQTYTWTGELATNESEQVTITGLNSTAGSHTLFTDVATVNGNADVYEFNDTKDKDFVITDNQSYETETVTLTLQNDIWGSEVSWELKNGEGDVLYSGGPYDDTDEMPGAIIQLFNVNINECYLFTIKDVLGNGICCTSGDGYYTLTTDDNTEIASNGDYGFSESVGFTITEELNTNDFALQGIGIYPNPTSNKLYITSKQSLDIEYTIYNNLGQAVSNDSLYINGQTEINTGSLSMGIYFIKITWGEQAKTFKLIKQ
ncbi:M43 family zinc metalloprotease [Flavobacterium rakeshii]|uniref:M43 family zinc metalloprotease n=1 Tax=Flavobacterium rakeshii TaxID=1038845 RepID=UPI002E7AEE91|nr:M43 family zinc metalloprotease [Flavobacterium rakeshii]MEE1898814.1 M43 family zinc metalloprotease [Flavobacterium rakeshii]